MTTTQNQSNRPGNTQGKSFTDADVQGLDTQFPRIYADRTELVYDPLDWQKSGLQQTASGYGHKLVMLEKINFNGRLYRLYCTCFSNAGSVWFIARGRKIYVN